VTHHEVQHLPVHPTVSAAAQPLVVEERRRRVEEERQKSPVELCKIERAFKGSVGRLPIVPSIACVRLEEEGLDHPRARSGRLLDDSPEVARSPRERERRTASRVSRR